MDYVRATNKVIDCINSATTFEHFKCINRIIDNLELSAKYDGAWHDRSLRGGLAVLANVMTRRAEYLKVVPEDKNPDK